MAKGRTPDTIEDALDQAIGYVGVERIAAWIGKSPNMVRKFSDPDKEHQLQLRCGLEIDRQLALAGYPRPFAELVAYLDGRHLRAAQQLAQGLAEDHGERPMKLATAMACEVTDLVKQIDDAEADGVWNAAEIELVCKAAASLGQRAAQLKRSAAARRGSGKSRSS